MKTTMTISVEEDIKAEFKIFAKELGTNPTTLLSMFMRDSARKWGIRFWSYTNIDFEFESFSAEELMDLKEDTGISGNTLKMERLLANA